MSSSKKATPPPRATPQDPNSKPRRESKAQQPESKPSQPKSKSRSESRSQQPESMPRDQIPKPPKEARPQQQESKPPEPISRSRSEPNPPRVTKPPAELVRHNFPRDVFRCCKCEKESKGVRYISSITNNSYHSECRRFKETDSSHRHSHNLRNHKKIFNCDGCKEEGFGKRFKCDQCGHELHTQCKFPEKPGQAPWLTNLPFKFQNKNNSSKKICSACTNDINGYYYHCPGFVGTPHGTEYGLYLHPCCISLKDKFYAELNRDVVTNINEHKYILSHDYEENIKCYLCKHNKPRTDDENYLGWSYICKSVSEPHRYHVYCIRKLVHEAWVTANCLENGEIGKTLETVVSKQVGISNGGSNSSNSSKIASKVLLTILQMVASTLMGDPTFGIVHLAAAFFN